MGKPITKSQIATLWREAALVARKALEGNE